MAAFGRFCAAPSRSPGAVSRGQSAAAASPAPTPIPEPRPHTSCPLVLKPTGLIHGLKIPVPMDTRGTPAYVPRGAQSEGC